MTTETIEPDRVETAYRARTAAFAERSRTATVPTDTSLLLTFRLGADLYAFDASHVTGIVRLTRWTPLPGGPPELLGIVNLRGEVRSVVDLAAMFGKLESAASPDSMGDGPQGYIVLLRSGDHRVGVRVEAVESVVRVAADLLRLPHSSALGKDDGNVVGVTADGVVVLDADAVVAAATGMTTTDARSPGAPESSGRRVRVQETDEHERTGDSQSPEDSRDGEHQGNGGQES